jgi:hypothetical protein
MAGCGSQQQENRTSGESSIEDDSQQTGQEENTQVSEIETEPQETDDFQETDDSDETGISETPYWEGELITFGNYGGEDMEWIVIQSDEEKALLWSEYCVDVQTYNDSQITEVSWETSDLRQRLNTSFLEEAFNTEEQQHIITSSL